jgi:hypothetical protein
VDYRSGMSTEAPAQETASSPASPRGAFGARRQSLLRLARAVLIVLASVAVGTLTLLAADRGGLFRLGPIAITINDYQKPFLWGLAAAMWLLVQDWGRGRWRLVPIGLMAALAALAMVNFARELPPIITASDLAVTELYTELAMGGRVLVGPYSRFGWHHPGPVYFYLQAPLYAVSGQAAAALYVGALAINIVALVTIVWVMARQERGPLFVLVTVGCVLLAWRLPRFLASPWTAHVPIFPSMAFAILCAAVASGRWKLLPVTVVFGSFIAQTHAALVPMVAALSASLAAVLVLRRERSSEFLSVLNISAWVYLAVWLLPMSEALSHAGGNVAALWQFFVIDPAEGQPFRNAFIHWSYGVTGVLRPDFGVPWGGHIALQYLWWGIPCAIAQVVLLVVIGRRHFRAGRIFEGHLAISALLASSVGLWALTRIRGDILDHEVFWLSAFGALNLAIISAAGLREIAMLRSTGVTVARLTSAGCVLLLMLFVALGVSHLRDFTAFEQRRRERAVIVAAHASIRGYLLREQIERPLLVLHNDRWSDGAGVLLRLYRDGTDVRVPEGWETMFTDTFAASGREDAIITIGPAALHQELRGRPANVVLLESDPIYVDAIRLTPALTR